jgi:DNA-binding transcriptional regulator GbsR (MarR family)
MLTQEKRIRETIEETGKVFEKFGLTPMQGRIISYFTVSDPPEKTFDELVKYFKASKSSVSNSLIYFKRVLENVTELKEYAYRTVSMRTPDYPMASEKILKWIENANRFQESLENTMEAIQNE